MNDASPPGEALVIAVEPLGSMIEEMQELSVFHGEEIYSPAAKAAGVVLKPSWGSMLALAQQGLMLAVSVREGASGPLVGYSTFILFPDFHWCNADGSPLLAAQDDAHFLLKRCRGPRVAHRLFFEAEAALTAVGVRKLSVHTKANSPQTRFFESLGFSPNDVIMTKFIGANTAAEPTGTAASSEPLED